jgi:hypothetical protein
MKRTRVLLVAVVVGGSLFAAVSASALNPQPLPPKIAGIVRDACTGLPIVGATVSVTPVDPAERAPGPTGTGLLGGFSISGLDPGAYSFAVSAPGYSSIGAGVPGVAGDQVMVDVDPAAVDPPVGGAVNETIVASVSLARVAAGPVPQPGPEWGAGAERRRP